MRLQKTVRKVLITGAFFKTWSIIALKIVSWFTNGSMEIEVANFGVSISLSFLVTGVIFFLLAITFKNNQLTV
jgi:hypothetical protein